ncbi:hypothetical protein [Hydrogenimonas thermophila]|uniref:Uncharacterized protein n=1 Tax=Hydrogenimonas thermophila TaxID=223786 RepID=A0A1I5P400_9BACT|nr:hypothetical protein [Hydrogenimonas thermophila]SFP28693.1 hypothetical protein SAMN05216234_11341 [Hydrogenimonas thermophila]
MSPEDEVRGKGDIMGWGAFLLGLLIGSADTGPEEGAKPRNTGPEGTFLGPNDRRTQREKNHKAQEYADIALERLPQYVRMYNAPNQDQLDNVLKAFESAAKLELKGGTNVIRMDQDIGKSNAQALKEWNDIREYFAIGLAEVARLFGGRVYNALTEHYSDYFLMEVRKFVAKHPLIDEGVLQDRYWLFEQHRMRFGQSWLKRGDEETARKIANIKTNYELFKFTAEKEIERRQKKLLDLNIPREKWKPLLEKYKDIRLQDRIPTMDEFKRSWDIATSLDKMID